LDLLNFFKKILNDVWRFDFSTNKWLKIVDFEETPSEIDVLERIHPGFALVKDWIYIVCGEDDETTP